MSDDLERALPFDAIATIVTEHGKRANSVAKQYLDLAENDLAARWSIHADQCAMIARICKLLATPLPQG